MCLSTHARDDVMTALPDTRHKAPTILDVAAYAGVSKVTVSNVLQGKIPVSENKRERVLSAVAELGYQPNAGARSMRQGSRTARQSSQGVSGSKGERAVLGVWVPTRRIRGNAEMIGNSHRVRARYLRHLCKRHDPGVEAQRTEAR